MAGPHLRVEAGRLRRACWGSNWTGAATPPAGSFVAVSAGRDHTCGLRSDGSAACWGNNDYGQATPPTGSFVSVSAGARHTCGVRSDGSVACWGSDEYGQATLPAGSFSPTARAADPTPAATAAPTMQSVLPMSTPRPTARPPGAYLARNGTGGAGRPLQRHRRPELGRKQ